MIDSHCHLADEAFAGDLEEVVGRAQASGVTHAMCILAAGDSREAEQAARLTVLWPSVRFAIGVHPHQAGDFSKNAPAVGDHLERAIAAQPNARAVGEIGLDYHYDFAPRDVQQAVFRRQIQVARSLRLPVVIHTREADEDTFAILNEEGGGELRGILHCFTGDAGRARRGLDLGFHLSFAGITTFPKAQDIREAAAIVPDDRLLVETDSPYLAPVPHRGKRNEPAWVVETARRLAEIRGVTLPDLDACVTRAFEALIG